MDTLEQRERAFEAHFAFSEHMAFTVATYRNRLLGLWAGERLGLAGAALDAYARDVVHQSLEPKCALDPVERVCRDLMARGCGEPEGDIRQRFLDFGQTAADRLAA
jgi:hypothetical protein